MYNKILVPVSFDSDRNSAGAIQIAQALSADGAQITLMHVMEHIPGYAISYMPTDYLAESRGAIEQELANMGRDLPNAQAVVIEGHSGRTIVDWAEENGVECIVIASHRPGMQDLLLGSTAAQVVRHAKCAVHVLR
ncbi:Nucleotide-binding universal stress protein, UspA family [Thalassovita litoralis]|jgi:nucleotide-binding universal stress UspA family protein|uniref:Nucleotide-binding universal stress protein, UspA family n=1 Tax=Thalassovita litoralis TaxID=1010611 RepID=A0A521CV87_9RHOB|nr:universal stress protein [Thalassovita litoralis]SMO62580.1 Nucleotide-binding universal stress protein, UspA family [Thalassovita litoralis]